MERFEPRVAVLQKRGVADTWHLPKRFEYLHFAFSVKITLALGEFTGNGVGVREVVHAVSAAFEDDLLMALQADERAVRLGFKICGDGLPVGFALGGEHGDCPTILPCGWMH